MTREENPYLPLMQSGLEFTHKLVEEAVAEGLIITSGERARLLAQYAFFLHPELRRFPLQVNREHIKSGYRFGKSLAVRNLYQSLLDKGAVVEDRLDSMGFVLLLLDGKRYLFDKQYVFPERDLGV